MKRVIPVNGNIEFHNIKMSLSLTDKQSIMVASRASEGILIDGAGKDLVLSGKRQLPKPMLTKVYVSLWRH